MLRLRLDKLQKQNDLYYFSGQPFNGIGYEIDEVYVVGNYKITDGVKGETFEEWGQEVPRVLGTALFDVDPNGTQTELHKHNRYHFEGKMFEGISYVFDPNALGTLRLEADCRDGQIERYWDASGRLMSECFRDNETGNLVAKEYYETGSLKDLTTHRISASYTENAKLKSLLIEPGFSSGQLCGVEAEASTTLTLSGAAMTDDILFKVKELKSVSNLYLADTAISSSGLAYLRNCHNLQELRTRDNIHFTKDDVEKLMQAIPGCSWRGARPTPRDRPGV